MSSEGFDRTTPHPPDSERTRSQARPSGDEDATRSVGDAPSAPPPDVPESIGAYRILGKLGEGGMGVVFEAEQQSPRRRVALKIVRGGEFVDENRVRLFQREVDTLARLQHPDIGAIYESGRTEAGQHFFAMELVRGETLDRFMERRPARVTPREMRFRLSLLRRIADAVHYAHQRGVIHRDLKPSNIVVTEPVPGGESASSDPDPLPGIKILDFGLARITEGDVAAASMVTEVGVIKGTLPYMSPEQARGDSGAIDVRADVYALGVVLYEMLAGNRPYDVSDRSLVEAVRVICEEAAAPVGRSMRGVRRLDPDVETIVGKALEKDPDQRYASAAALSEDIGRYLASEPILAQPPSTIYQLRKFARRNRVLVGGLAATFLALVAGTTVSTVLGLREAAQRKEAERARNDLESVADFQASMLSEVDPERMGVWLAADLREGVEAAVREEGLSESEMASFLDGYDASMRRMNVTNTALDVIDRNILGPALEAIEKRFGERPLIDARLRGTVGRTYLQLGRYGRSEPLLRAALETYGRLLGDDDPRTLAAMDDLGRLFTELDRYDEAEPMLLGALETRRRILGPDDPQTLRSMHLLARLYWVQGRLEEAESLLVSALEEQKRRLGDEHPETLSSMNLLANVYSLQGRSEEAEPLWLQALEGRKRVLGNDHPETLASLGNVATLYADLGRYDEAQRTYLDLLDIQKSKYGDDHPLTLGSMYHLANLYAHQGRYDEAEPIYLEALEANKRVLGEDSSYTLALMGNLAFMYQRQRRFDEAESLYVEALETQQRVYGPDHWATPGAMHSLAAFYRSQGRFGEAEPLYVEGLESQRRVYGDGHPETVRIMRELADLYVATKRPDLARPLAENLRKAIDLLPEGQSPRRAEFEEVLLELETALTSAKSR